MTTDPAEHGGTERKPFVVLGVAGGIAAYKAAEVLRNLTESGHRVRVVPTEAALHFVGQATWSALSGEPAATDVWTGVQDVPHVRLGREADLVLVVPATADVLARAAVGRADDLLTSTLLTARCPVVFAPAMHTEMWEHPATVANVATLRGRGNVVIEPAIGRLTGVDTGKGRLPDPDEIALVARSILGRGRTDADLAGRRVVVSAGGTREPLDPVRFLGNRSSGRQGYAVARAAVARGAEVVLVSANVALPDPAGVELVRVGTAAEMHRAVFEAAETADAVVMAAAVADFRPAAQQQYKIKKRDGEPEPIALERNPDILAELCDPDRRAGRSPQVLVGFAAETGSPGRSVLDLGREKLSAKGADLLVVNEVGESAGFEVSHNAAVVLAADGSATEVPATTKDLLAHRIWDLAVPMLDPR
ncbi:MAG: phosphopantothenoylcysteine decarboxylase / phosphopantothenate---cysteine ligase [Frankiaceae bacterium]|nr:phosphopantothenoylcysteine decarboxylase / phosphopantothenate---cysteine ligase [Frankiaceae bacterium]